MCDHVIRLKDIRTNHSREGLDIAVNVECLKCARAGYKLIKIDNNDEILHWRE